ncbi:unnamed protein product [Blepharisma stoltei]|uniref:Meiosis-specific nuclear structural protein 1 n=1 Tax=Blepharisma stoltei TaxID=1481888 RepID=A0AAU9J973_9CILI|nr:unnamed protein product [Blepharisma stoltei]
MESTSPSRDSFECGVVEHHGRFVEAKKLRKQADDDAKRLANRVALLRLEAAKASRLIEKTRVRVLEAKEVKIRNLENQINKDELKKRRQNEQERKAAFNHELREEFSLKKQIVKESVLTKKRMSASAQRQRRKDDLDCIEQQKNETVLTKSLVAQKVKNEKRLAEEKRMRLEAEKKAQIRAELEKKIKAEENARLMREEEIARLELEETELIRRLQNSQSIQKSVFEELSMALTSPLDSRVLLDEISVEDIQMQNENIGQ